jgi:hypothetical protein
MKRLVLGAVVCALVESAFACELCAIYGATTARGESVRGFQLNVAEQFTAYGTLRFEGASFSAAGFFEGNYLDNSITHVVPGYNFSERFGLNLNIPIIYRAFDRYEIRYRESGNTFISTIRHEESTLFGLGDMALIGRLAVLQKLEMKYSFTFNLFAGVKFPTGDNDRVKDEVEQARRAIVALGPIHEHNVLPIHQSDLSLGSGSFDGIFGTAASMRWDRWFFDNQIQYYLRTEADDYKFGNEWIISGGPGAYLLLAEPFTLSLQARASYESKARDEVFGRKSNSSGISSWYVGPLIGVTCGEHLSANAGFEFPWHIYNHGLQMVPDYRVHAGLTWRF